MDKEVTVKGWIVREPVIGHFLTFFRYEPIKRSGNRWVDCHGNKGSILADYNHNLFNEIQPETGPVKVELTLKLV